MGALGYLEIERVVLEHADAAVPRAGPPAERRERALDAFAGKIGVKRGARDFRACPRDHMIEGDAASKLVLHYSKSQQI